MNLKYKVFVINLDRSGARLEKATRLLNEANIEFERFSAIDGEQLTSSAIQAIYNFDDDKSFYKALNKGEIACYLSHRAVWQKLIDEKLDFAIILEDDFADCNLLSIAIEQIEQLPKKWDYIKLAMYHRKRNPIATRQLEHSKLCVFDKTPASTQAQAVSLSGANKLVNSSKNILRPVDLDIQHGWEKQLITFGLLPAPVSIDSSEHSEIERNSARVNAQKNRMRQFKQAWRFKSKNRAYTKFLVECLKKLNLKS